MSSAHVPPRHPDYSDFVADNFDTAILDVFGDYARRDLDGEAYAALHADVIALSEDLLIACDDYDPYLAADAARELRQRIGGVEQLPGYVASLVAGARYRACQQEFDPFDAPDGWDGSRPLT